MFFQYNFSLLSCFKWEVRCSAFIWYDNNKTFLIIYGVIYFDFGYSRAIFILFCGWYLSFLELQVSDIFTDSSFKVFTDALVSGGIIKVVCVPSGAKCYSNTALKKGDIYNEAIKSGAKGLPFLKVLNDGNNWKHKYFILVKWLYGSQITTDSLKFYL